LVATAESKDRMPKSHAGDLQSPRSFNFFSVGESDSRANSLGSAGAPMPLRRLRSAGGMDLPGLAATNDGDGGICAIGDDLDAVSELAAGLPASESAATALPVRDDTAAKPPCSCCNCCCFIASRTRDGTHFAAPPPALLPLRLSEAAGGALDDSSGDGGTDTDMARPRPTEANGMSTADTTRVEAGMDRPAGDGCALKPGDECLTDDDRPSEDMAAGSEGESSYEEDTRPRPQPLPPPHTPEVEPRRTNAAKLFLIESGREKSCAARSRLRGRLPTLLPSEAANGDAVVLDAVDLRSFGASECCSACCCCCRLDESSDLPRADDGSRDAPEEDKLATAIPACKAPSGCG
jgi:hypothetical protein